MALYSKCYSVHMRGPTLISCPPHTSSSHTCTSPHRLPTSMYMLSLFPGLQHSFCSLQLLLYGIRQTKADKIFFLLAKKRLWITAIVIIIQLSVRSQLLLCLDSSITAVVMPVQVSQTWKRLSCSHSAGLRTSISQGFQTGEGFFYHSSSIHPPGMAVTLPRDYLQ